MFFTQNAQDEISGSYKIAFCAFVKFYQYKYLESYDHTRFMSKCSVFSLACTYV